MRSYIRRKQMLEYLADHDDLSVDEAVKLFEASSATVRRDFTEIAASGSVSRVRGGIRRILNLNDNLLPFSLREKWYSAEKRFLALHVFKYIREAESLFIDGGSTTAHLGMFLKEPKQVVITNSMPLCNILSEIFPSGGGPEIQMTGGRFHPESRLLLGPNAEAGVAQYHADFAILSVRGINAAGLYNHNEQIAGIGRAMIANAKKTVIIADHSKIGASAMHRVCAIDKIDALFTVQTDENRDVLEKIRIAGVKVFGDTPFDA